MVRPAVLLGFLALGAVACASGEAASPPSAAPTVGNVGALPDALHPVATVPSSTVPSSPDEPAVTNDGRRTAPTTVAADPNSRPVGRMVEGNRLLVIGDSIIASTAPRYGDDMCDQLVPMGWAVEIDAETGQQIGFAQEVLRQRLSAGWDAAVIMLGNNYNGDPQAYADALEEILDELEPRPVVLLSVTQFRPDRAEVNYVVRSLATERDNVRVVEWAERTADDDGLLAGDGLHLSDAGRRELVRLTSQALGRAPVGSDGACLPTRHTDDSARSPSGIGSGG